MPGPYHKPIKSESLEVARGNTRHLYFCKWPWFEYAARWRATDPQQCISNINMQRSHGNLSEMQILIHWIWDGAQDPNKLPGDVIQVVIQRVVPRTKELIFTWKLVRKHMLSQRIRNQTIQSPLKSEMLGVWPSLLWFKKALQLPFKFED